MDVLRDAMAKRFGEQVTGGQRNEERRVENRSGVVSDLDPEPLSQSSFVNHRDDWSNSYSDSSYHRRRRRIGDRSDDFAAISQRFKEKKEKMDLLTNWALTLTHFFREKKKKTTATETETERDYGVMVNWIVIHVFLFFLFFFLVLLLY